MSQKFPKYEEWTSGAGKPTLKQLEKFAHAAHAPLGFLLLPKPSREEVPIPDFRTVANVDLTHPSPNLLDTIYMCQKRQEWYRVYAASHGYLPLDFVGSATTSGAAEPVADAIRRRIGFNLDDRSAFANWEAALRKLIDLIEGIGVLVMVNGVVGADTSRKLDPQEFRGFALTDDVAPLIFVNGSDTKAAQIFTLVHELAHIWLGESALSDAQMGGRTNNDHELWCNRVAAEVLVPLASIRSDYGGEATPAELARLAKLFASAL
ncbi:ImmA/IrrE family metallo-endopeptidase [Cryobacterium frigoriphilum]|uniref:ImmA/IrrE family metallo-endopeptidase n=1 Tax=Cryobacterium frigoriphilum TaxID=1259150 RepID=UPI001F5451CA|nr:ImmA/IrrE family metallo-endopeptidase [Cryobacterium frigoriphilum]